MSLAFNIGGSNESIDDIEMTLHLEGNMFDPERITSSRGFYDSEKNSIRFNKENTDELVSIKENQVYHFDVSLLSYGEDFLKQTKIKDPHIGLSIDITGKRKNGQIVKLIDIEKKRIVFLSQFDVSGDTWFAKGDLKNVGLYPPVAEEDSTYTLVWYIHGATNPYTNVVFQTRLPEYVTFIQPEKEDKNFTYDEKSKTIIWKAGSIDTSKEENNKVQFQVQVKPSLGQVGKVIDLTKEITVRAHDEFSKEDVKKIIPAHTTNLVNDEISPITSGTVRGAFGKNE